MSVKSFKFVSPGVFVNEVDNSQLNRLPDAMGPVIIGRAERGPGMVPVTVNSFAEFVETFGEPVAGNQASDVWRQGNRLGPTYGAFAAQAYLKNGSPVTFIRLLGEAHPDAANDENKAGWSMDVAYGLLASDGVKTKLAAIIYSGGDAAPDAITITDGDLKISIPVVDSVGTSGTAGTQSIEVTDASTFGANAATFDIASALAATIAIAFDSSTSESSFDGTTLTIGTVDLVVDNTAASATALLSRVASEINALGATVAVTASSSGTTLSLVMDDVGEVTAIGANALFDMGGLGGNTPGSATAGTAAAAGATTNKVVLANFDKNSKKYIRKVMNTNPTLVNDRQDAPAASETYFLGQTFDQSIAAELGEITSASLVKVASYGSYIADTKVASTPWVYSQFLGDVAGKKNTANLASADLTKLFRFHSLYAGEWEQKNFKISIADISASDRFNPYGSFSVLVRSASDTDAAPVVYERYSNVNLNPNSPNFISAAIGDMEMRWEDEERRYRHIGQYANQSRFIRVEVQPSVASGEANAELIPFGFAAPLHKANGTITSNHMPAFSMRKSTSTDASLSVPTEAFFGITVGEMDENDNPTSVFDASYQDLVRPFYGAEDMFETEGELFSLDLLELDGANGAKFDSGATDDAMKTGNSINAGIPTNDPETTIPPSYDRVLDLGFDSFTMPLAGGLDGLNIKEVEPFCDNVLDGETATSHYAYNSISKAIDMVSDAEVVECNLMAIPGVSTPGLTGKLITVCEKRGDALAVIDIEKDYTPAGWSNQSDEEARLPDVTQAISKLKQRALSSSYGCAFYPWVQVNDQINNRLVWMPPSVVALGTMASSAANSELWFAPAGFTRGGLTGGAGGLPVSQVRLRLNSKQRDKLYEANINPIAQFPSEGIVVFGQKTLQVTPSALDRINVRRLMIFLKKEISRMASTVLFDQNVQVTWARFLSQAEPFLGSVKTRFGLSEYKIVLDETTTTPELVDRNIVYAKVFLKPARAIEFIAIDFVITNTGASFDD